MCDEFYPYQSISFHVIRSDTHKNKNCVFASVLLEHVSESISKVILSDRTSSGLNNSINPRPAGGGGRFCPPSRIFAIT